MKILILMLIEPRIKEMIFKYKIQSKKQNFYTIISNVDTMYTHWLVSG